MTTSGPTRARAGVVLVLVDVINAFDFPGCGPLLRAAARSAPRMARLAQRARATGTPIVYVNDNFGQWRSDFRATVRACLHADMPGSEIVRTLQPSDGDYFVLKPQHSGFYGTSLDLLLGHLQAHTLVLAGFAANLCVVFTANDAHMRGYHLVVPADCTEANTPALKRGALLHIRTALGGDTPPSSSVRFDRLRSRAKKPRGQAF